VGRRCRQWIGRGHDVIGRRAGLQLGEELQDPCAALGRLVDPEVQLRDPAKVQSLAEEPSHVGHRAAQCGEAGGSLVRLADLADPDLGVTQVGHRLDVGDRREPDRGIVDILGEDRPDLLAQQRVDPIGPLGHRLVVGVTGRRALSS
jgi:hypothetical protein